LARLGLRSGEATGLRLDDVDWRAAVVRVTGKGDDHQLMPLPAEVGEALAAFSTTRHAARVSPAPKPEGLDPSP